MARELTATQMTSFNRMRKRISDAIPSSERLDVLRGDIEAGVREAVGDAPGQHALNLVWKIMGSGTRHTADAMVVQYLLDEAAGVEPEETRDFVTRNRYGLNKYLEGFDVDGWLRANWHVTPALTDYRRMWLHEVSAGMT